MLHDTFLCNISVTLRYFWPLSTHTKGYFGASKITFCLKCDIELKNLRLPASKNQQAKTLRDLESTAQAVGQDYIKLMLLLSANQLG